IVPSLPLGTGQEFRIGPGCETGPIIPNPSNPEVVYGSCKGQFSVQNEETTDEMRYWVGAESLYGNGGGTLIYRFQRVSPMEVSPWPPHAVYYGSQYLHRTTDGGVTWKKISPDLTADPPGEPQEPSGTPITRDATGEEVYSTLYAIRESPVQKGVIWTGSNDGLVYVTRDDGAHWENVTPKDLPAGGRVQNIEPGVRHAGTAYVAIYRFLLGDFAPYIYATKDFGKTWKRLTDGANGIARDEPTRVVREDPAREGLLFAGTEFGMYVSFDDGARWQSFQLNLPVTPVTDIRIAHKDLVLSTQGRSFWILDDITPLEQMTEKVTSADAWLYGPREAVRTPPRGFGGGLVERSGVQYPSAGAGINYYLRSAPAGDVTLEVLDAAGKPVRKFSSAAPAGGEGAGRGEEDFAGGGDEEGGGGGRGGRGGPVRLDKSAGMHRFYWDLRYPGPWQSANRPEGPNGPMAVPGKYAVKLTVGSWTATEPLTVIEDPRVTKAGVTTADLREQFEHNLKVRELVSEANRTAAKLRAAQAKARSAAPGSPEAHELATLNDIAARLLTSPIRYSQPGLLTHITYLFGMTNATDQKIGRDAIDRYVTVKKSLDEITTEINKATGGK
ncbi:MAG TPA: sialidase family protein, partial [Verrucomicrobiae bacterium]|nr:sialidase family protein [Verrucomicrobiae bacterium]